MQLRGSIAGKGFLQKGECVLFEVSFDQQKQKWVALNVVPNISEKTPSSDKLSEFGTAWGLSDAQVLWLSNLSEDVSAAVVKEFLANQDCSHEFKQEDSPSDYGKKVCALLNKLQGYEVQNVKRTPGNKAVECAPLSENDKELIKQFVQRWQINASTASWMQNLGADVVRAVVAKFNPPSSSPEDVHGKLRAYAGSIARSMANQNLAQSMMKEVLARSRKIAISGLPKEATIELVTDLLCQYGEVEHVSMMMGSMPLAFSRFAEARMASPDQAKAAVDALNGTVPYGFVFPIRIHIAAPDEAEPSERLLVKDLPTDATEETVLQLFSPYGKVAEVKMVGAEGLEGVDETTASRSAAIVHLGSLEDARLAMSCLHGQMLEDSSQPLSVTFAFPSGQSQVLPEQGLQRLQPNVSIWGQLAADPRSLQPQQPACPPPAMLQQPAVLPLSAVLPQSQPSPFPAPPPAAPDLFKTSGFSLQAQNLAAVPLAGCQPAPGSQASCSTIAQSCQAFPKARPAKPTAKQVSAAVPGTASALRCTARPRPTSRAASPGRPKPSRASFLDSMDVKAELMEDD